MHIDTALVPLTNIWIVNTFIGVDICLYMCSNMGSKASSSIGSYEGSYVWIGARILRQVTPGYGSVTTHTLNQTAERITTYFCHPQRPVL